MSKSRRYAPFSIACVLCGKYYDHSGTKREDGRLWWDDLRSLLFQDNQFTGFGDEPIKTTGDGWYPSKSAVCVKCIAKLQQIYGGN